MCVSDRERGRDFLWGSTRQLHNSTNSSGWLCYAIVLQTWQIANALLTNCPSSLEYKRLLWVNCHPKGMHKSAEVSWNNKHMAKTLSLKANL